MGFYSFKTPSVQSWVGWAVGGATAYTSYIMYDTFRSRRGAVPVFNSTRVQRAEEHARYPCSALKGLDVVVMNYYVAEDEAARRRREREQDTVVFMSEEEKAEALRQEQSRPLFSLGRLRQFASLFSNETNHVSRGVSLNGKRVLSEKDDITGVRLVTGDATEAAGGVRRVLPRGDGDGVVLSPHTLQFADSKRSTDDAAVAQEGLVHPPTSSSEGGPKEEDATARPFVASSTWPEHTEKYAALILAPSRTALRGVQTETTTDAAMAAHLRDPLRWLADAATHQSLIRCRGRSALVDMNCDADPTYLGAAYLRVMLSAFLLLPSMAGSSSNSSQPLRVAVLGVAGGSLPHFLQHYFSSAIKAMDLIDIEPQCFRAAAEQLGMGKVLGTALDATDGAATTGSSTRVRVHACDAAEFLEEHQRQLTSATSSNASGAVVGVKGTRPVFTDAAARGIQGRLTRPYDVLFVDLFVGSELAGEVSGPAFVRLCRQSLSPLGVVAFNLPERNRAFVDACERTFGKSNVYTIPTPHTSNTIVLARGGVEAVGTDRAGLSTASQRGSTSTALPHLSHRVLFKRAQQLQETYKLPYDLANHYPVWWRFW